MLEGFAKTSVRRDNDTQLFLIGKPRIRQVSSSNRWMKQCIDLVTDRCLLCFPDTNGKTGLFDILEFLVLVRHVAQFPGTCPRHVDPLTSR